MASPKNAVLIVRDDQGTLQSMYGPIGHDEVLPATIDLVLRHNSLLTKEQVIAAMDVQQAFGFQSNKLSFVSNLAHRPNASLTVTTEVIHNLDDKTEWLACWKYLSEYREKRDAVPVTAEPGSRCIDVPPSGAVNT